MAFAFLKNLIAGTNENVNDVMTDLNQIKDELNGATSTNTMALGGDLSGTPSASLVSKITGSGTRFGTHGALLSSSTSTTGLYSNYNPGTDRLIDTSKSGWRIQLNASGELLSIGHAPATAGSPTFATVSYVDSTGLANFVGGLQSGGVAAILEGDSRLTDQRTPSNNSVTSAKILDGTIVDGDVNAANKDGASGTASMRTLGTGATQAMAGNATPTPGAGTVAGAQLGTLPSARVFNTGTVTVPDNVRTAMACNATGWDVGTGTAQHSDVTNNSRLTCRLAGRYFISANVEWTTAGGGVTALRIAELRLNGTTLIARNTVEHSGASPNSVYAIPQQVHTIYPLGVGDYVETTLYQVSSVAGDLTVIRSANYSPEFMWHFMGAQ